MSRTNTGAASAWVVLVLVCFAQFMVVLDATIVNVALPSIQRDLVLDPAGLQWVVNGYTLLFGGFLLLGGRAADLFGRKRVFLAGIALFTAASLVNALSTGQEMLIAGRALQGLGAALVSPAALSIITTTFADGEERTKALGVWGAIAAGGAAMGLLMGGVLTQLLSWEWIFLVNVPIGAATFAAALRLIPESRSEHPGTVDYWGATTVTAGLVLLVYVIVKAERWGWGSLETLGLAAVALALLGLFLLIEARRSDPLVRLSIFRVRSLASSNGAMLLVASGMFAMFFFSSLYVQQVMGYGPLKAGLSFLPVTAGIGIGAAAAQQLVRRVGPRNNALVGITVATVGMLLLTGLDVGGTYLRDVLPGLAIMAVGMGLTFVPITLIATTGLGDRDAGLASGIFNTSQQVGGALGLAVLSTLATDRTKAVLGDLGRPPDHADALSALVEGFQVAFIGGAGLLALAVVVLLVTLRPRHLAHVDVSARPVLAG